MLSRRSFIFGLGAGLFSARSASARDIGVRGLDQLAPALERMWAISEGAGPVVHILVSPGCARATEMWEATRLAKTSLTIRWVPCSSAYEGDIEKVGKCLSAGTVDAVRDLLFDEPFMDDPRPSPRRAAIQMANFTNVEKLLFESTGRTPMFPTLVFNVRRGVQVVRGSIGSEQFPQVQRIAL